MTHNVFPPSGGIFTQNATGYKPMSEEKVPVVAGVSYCSRAHACSGRRHDTAFPLLIGLQLVAF